MPTLKIDFSTGIKKYDICLADSAFKNPDLIDLLLDVSVSDEVSKNGRISLGKRYQEILYLGGLSFKNPQRAQAN